MALPMYRIRHSVAHGGGHGTPVLAEPKLGYWYHGESERGTGAVAQYQGYGEFTMGDGTVVDMAIYDHLVEHHKRT